MGVVLSLVTGTALDDFSGATALVLNDGAYDWRTLALLATWLVVIPYLVLFPPQLTTVRAKVKDQQQKRALKKFLLKPNWRARTASLTNAADPSQLSLQYVVPKGHKALVILVNRRSGGGQGAVVYDELKKYVQPGQIFDLSETPDVPAILRSITGDVRLMVCGGDGTISWVMQAATANKTRYPVAVLPLGTGNDLARMLGWGSGVNDPNSEAVLEYAAAAVSAKPRSVDRWLVTITPADGGAPTTKVMVNYLSFGVDAEISMRFHTERENYPERFTSQQKNLMKYAWLGFEASFVGKALDDCCIVRGDGERLDVHPSWKGCIISNVPSYHGGKDFWGGADIAASDGFDPVRTDDKRLEVMGMAGTFHFGMCNLYIDNAVRVAQPHNVTIDVVADTAMQCDGEPWTQGPATIVFQHLDQYPMLERR